MRTSWNTLSDLTLEDISKYFHLPINEVSVELGVCATVLKKICRRNGIPRWPHRQIKSLDRMISSWKSAEPRSPEEAEKIAGELARLEAKRALLVNPRPRVPVGTTSLVESNVLKQNMALLAPKLTNEAEVSAILATIAEVKAAPAPAAAVPAPSGTPLMNSFAPSPSPPMPFYRGPDLDQAQPVGPPPPTVSLPPSHHLLSNGFSTNVLSDRFLSSSILQVGCAPAPSYGLLPRSPRLAPLPPIAPH